MWERCHLRGEVLGIKDDHAEDAQVLNGKRESFTDRRRAASR